MAAAAAIDIPALIERQGIGWFQIRTLILCIAVVILDGFDAQIVGYLIPALANAWQVDRSAFGLVQSAGFLGLLAGAFLFGVLADRFGRKRVIIACTLVFGAFSLLTVTAGSRDSLLALRFLTGLGIGGAVPNCIALIAEYSPQRRRATMTTTLSAGVSLGAMLAGWLTAALLAPLGWRALFAVGGLLPLALAPLLVVALPESLRLLVLQRRPAREIAAVLAKLAPALAGASPTALALGETRREGLPVRHLLTDGRARPTLLMWAGFLLNLLALYSLISWMPTVMSGIGLSATAAPLVASLFSLGGIVGAVGVGFLIDRLGAHGVLAATFLMAGLFLLALGAVGPAPVWLAALVFAVGFCTAGGQHGANAHAGDFYPTFMRSTGVGWAMGIGRIGASAGPLLFGMLLARHWGLPAILAVYAAATAAAAAAFVLMGRVSRRSMLQTEQEIPPRPHAVGERAG